MATRLPYTTQSVEHAFARHRMAGRIGDWTRDSDTRWTVYINTIDVDASSTLELRSLREAWVFIQGLCSAQWKDE